MPGLIKRWNCEQGRPSIRYGTLGDVRQRAARIDDRDLPILRGDWTDFWNFGCASAPIATGLSRRAKPLLQAAALVAKTEANSALWCGPPMPSISTTSTPLATTIRATRIRKLRRQSC